MDTRTKFSKRPGRHLNVISTINFGCVNQALFPIQIFAKKIHPVISLYLLCVKERNILRWPQHLKVWLKKSEEENKIISFSNKKIGLRRSNLHSFGHRNNTNCFLYTLRLSPPSSPYTVKTRRFPWKYFAFIFSSALFYRR